MKQVTISFENGDRDVKVCDPTEAAIFLDYFPQDSFPVLISITGRTMYNSNMVRAVNIVDVSKIEA